MHHHFSYELNLLSDDLCSEQKPTVGNHFITQMLVNSPAGCQLEIENEEIHNLATLLGTPRKYWIGRTFSFMTGSTRCFCSIVTRYHHTTAVDLSVRHSWCQSLVPPYPKGVLLNTDLQTGVQ